MEEKLVGVHEIKAKLKSSAEVTDYYARRGDPKIEAKPGTKPSFRNLPASRATTSCQPSNRRSAG